MTKRDKRRSGPATWPDQGAAVMAAAAALLAPNVDPEDLTDAQLDARIAAAGAAHRRALKLALLRFSEQNAARIHAELEAEGDA